MLIKFHYKFTDFNKDVLLDCIRLIMPTIPEESQGLAQNISSKGNLLKALEIAGDSHAYQNIVIFCLIISQFVANMCMVSTSLILSNPTFICHQSPSLVISEEQACSLMKTEPFACHATDSFTLTSQISLYCEKQSQRTLIQSVYAIGAMFTLPILNLVSDLKGRKVTYLLASLSVALGSTALFIGGIQKKILLLYFGEVFLGIGAFSIGTVSLAITADFCSDLLRQKAIAIYGMIYSLTLITLAILYVLEVDWKVVLFGFIFSPILIVLTFLWFFMPESPYVLINLNRRAECIESFLKVAEHNERDTQQNVNKIISIVENQPLRAKQEESSIEVLFQVLKQTQYLIPLFVISTCHGMRDANSTGMNYAAKDIGFGYAVNLIVTGLAQLFSVLVLYRYIDDLQRKKFIFCTASMCLLLECAFFWDFISESHVIASLIMMLVRMILGVTFVLICCLEVECFPVQVQSTAIGIIGFLCLFGFFLGPIIVDLAKRASINPMGLLGLTSLLIMISVLFIDEKPHHRNRSDTQNGV